MKNLFYLSLLFGVVLSSCKFNEQPKTQETNKQARAVNVPEFNADSAYRFIKEQLDFGPRVPNSSAHEKCAAYLAAKMKGYLTQVIVQTGQVKAYDGTVLNIKNIIASLKPELNNRIFICAHWDSRPFADHDPDPKNRTKPVPAANETSSNELASRAVSVEK